MDLGAAIKAIRKERKMGQKELAEKSEISVNALSQIELNNTFPQKSNLEKICAALDIPVSYLLFFSINENDVPKEKRDTFNVLNGAIRNLLIDDKKIS